MNQCRRRLFKRLFVNDIGDGEKSGKRRVAVKSGCEKEGTTGDDNERRSMVAAFRERAFAAAFANIQHDNNTRPAQIRHNNKQALNSLPHCIIE